MQFSIRKHVEKKKKVFVTQTSKVNQDRLNMAVNARSAPKANVFLPVCACGGVSVSMCKTSVAPGACACVCECEHNLNHVEVRASAC